MKKYFLALVCVFVVTLSLLLSHTASAGVSCNVQQFKFVPSTSTTSRFIAAANGGASDATKANFQISSNCDIEITELKFDVNTGYNVQNYTVYSKYTTIPDGITSVKVQDGNGSYISAKTTAGSYVSPTTAKGLVDITGLSLKGKSFNLININTLLSYREVTNFSSKTWTGILSGATPKISLHYVKFKDTATGTIYTFCASGCTLMNTKFLSSPEMTLVGSYPDITATSITNKLTTGLNEVAEVTFTNNNKTDVAMGVLPITISGFKNVLTNKVSAMAYGSTYPQGKKVSMDKVIVTDVNGKDLLDTKGNKMVIDDKPLWNDMNVQQHKIEFTTCTNNTCNGAALVIPAGTSKTIKVFLDIAKLGASGTSSVNVNLGSGHQNFTWFDTGVDMQYPVVGDGKSSWGAYRLPSYTTLSQTITN